MSVLRLTAIITSYIFKIHQLHQISHILCASVSLKVVSRRCETSTVLSGPLERILGCSSASFRRGVHWLSLPNIEHMSFIRSFINNQRSLIRFALHKI
ncbi:hypothetical protein BABINDRAFT_73357 [Babjeviella inositovora NRRL Y-12698]|uniref:Uncharacterized protein n=1 Tax=Babjeviella inositovora NRRL Y-12698 TaxID=984486 RepID=A0A1E3QXZ4_9ASCO|nr:uncharacterized protein BABINDRAFT_73357 [Babjeviella inositovora NRRL Y-12698]ODQ82535.1 hypothetical protein BABINDRAFT_73357 [Babjeviella inositovora NRRL Y-12698]